MMYNVKRCANMHLVMRKVAGEAIPGNFRVNRPKTVRAGAKIAEQVNPAHAAIGCMKKSGGRHAALCTARQAKGGTKNKWQTRR